MAIGRCHSIRWKRQVGSVWLVDEVGELVGNCHALCWSLTDWLSVADLHSGPSYATMLGPPRQFVRGLSCPGYARLPWREWSSGCDVSPSAITARSCRPRSWSRSARTELHVSSDNTRAQRLYQALGFVIVEADEGSGLVMLKELSQ